MNATPSTDGPAKSKSLGMRYRPSQATLVASIVGAVLLLLFVVNWAAYRSQPSRVAWSDYMQWPQLFALGILWLVICAMTYWLVQLWHEELPSDDASIELAWQAGLRALRARGQRLDQLPLFLVLGGSDRLHQQQLLEQSGLVLQSEVVPATSDTPMHWAFTDQGVWLFVHAVGTYTCVSKRLAMRPTTDAWSAELPLLVSQAATVESLSDSVPQATRYQGQESLAVPAKQRHSLQACTSQSTFSTTTTTATLEPSIENGSATTSSNKTETSAAAALESLEELLQNASQAESVAGGANSRPNANDSGIALEPTTAIQHSAWQTELAFQSAAQLGVLSSTEITRQQHALQEICRRVRSQRGAIAPANGVVAIVHGQQLMAGTIAASELGLALRSDLQVVQESWQSLAPTTIIVDGMESLSGTRELVRRGGPEVAKTVGLGTAFPMRYQPEKPLVAHACALAVGQIESRIHSHLQPTDALMPVGNHALFELLIACRSRLLPALQTFAGEAVGLDIPSERSSEPSMLAGIHFVASGQRVTEQAWSRTAFAQVIQSQNFLRWTSERLRSERRIGFAISCLKALAAILALAFVLALL